MTIISTALIALIALLHVWFMVLEMFLWRKPIGLKTFGQTQTAADASAVLAANQGLYNGFLAAGLTWSLVASPVHGASIKIFFLACVLVAGIYGGVTANKKILFVQALPSALALTSVLFL